MVYHVHMDLNRVCFSVVAAWCCQGAWSGLAVVHPAAQWSDKFIRLNETTLIGVLGMDCFFWLPSVNLT